MKLQSCQQDIFVECKMKEKPQEKTMRRFPNWTGPGRTTERAWLKMKGEVFQLW